MAVCDLEELLAAQLAERYSIPAFYSSIEKLYDNVAPTSFISRRHRRLTSSLVDWPASEEATYMGEAVHRYLLWRS